MSTTKKNIGETLSETLAFADKMDLDPVAMLRYVAGQYRDDDTRVIALEGVEAHAVQARAEIVDHVDAELTDDDARLTFLDETVHFPRAVAHWEHKVRPGASMTGREVYEDAGATWRHRGKKMSHYMKHQQALGKVQIIENARNGRDLYVKLSGLIGGKKD